MKRTMNLWLPRREAIRYQAQARALGIHASVRNQGQVAALPDWMAEELPSCPPYLAGAADYASEGVLLTVELTVSQEKELFGL